MIRCIRRPAAMATLLLLSATVLALETTGEAVRGPLDPVELQTWLDGAIPALMDTHHVPGAVIVVVRDGEVFLSSGYGYADLEDRRPVDPATTGFRVASVSKLFTTTAVLQQVEQGSLRLESDVNEYLTTFRIEDRFDRPVTLFNLLTHTPGFDDEYLRMSEPLEEEPQALEVFLAAEQPERVIPPGDLISYSNYGLALAGYLVEKVSGQPFAGYVREQILDPLGMENTRFGLPYPVPEEIATAYEYDAGEHRPLGYDRIPDAPAGDLVTTGEDMARFMIAHLQYGRYGDSRILMEATSREMQSRQFEHHPELTGWCLGFYEGRTNGFRTVEHGGSWRGFGTEMFLLPEMGLGVFLSTNLEYTPRFFRTFRSLFFDRYLPAEEDRDVVPMSGAGEEVERYAGKYLSVRRVRNSILRLGSFMSVVTVSADAEGYLTVRFPGGSIPPRKLAMVAPGLFRDVRNDSMVSSRESEDGDVSHLLLGGGALEKLSWCGDPGLHSILLGGCLALFVLTTAGWILGFLSRRLASGPPSPVKHSVRITAGLVCILQTVFLAWGFMTLGEADVYALMERVPTSFTVMLVLPLASVVLTAILAIRLFTGFRTGVGAPLASLHYLVLVLAAALVLVLEWHWNLLGFWY